MTEPATALPPAPVHPAPARPSLGARLLAFLRPSHLAWAIPGPIFHKEVWMAGRRATTYWIRGAFVLGMIGLVSMVFIAYRMENYGSASQRLQRLQQLAPSVTVTVIWFQYVAIVLSAIILSAPMICDEKRAGTLGTLLTTPLKAWQIVLGKMTALGVQLLVLALASTPLLLAIRLFGGVTAEVIAASTWITVSSAALASALGIFCSIGVKRSPTAAGGALLLFILSQFMVPMIVGILATVRSGMGPAMIVPMFVLSPPLTLAVATADLIGGGLPIPFKAIAWLIAGSWNWLLTLIVFFLATLSLRSRMRREGEHGPAGAPRPAAQAEPAAPPLLPAEGVPAAGAVVQPAPKSRRARRAGVPHTSRVVGDDPVLWRELRQATFRRPLHAKIMFGAIFVLALWVYMQVMREGPWGSMAFDTDNLGEEALNYPVLALGSSIAMLLASFSASQLISSERESRTWEVLLTTPLTAWQIIWGKFLGAIRRQWVVPAIVLGHFTMVSIFGPVRLLLVFEVAAILAAGLLGVTAFGVLCSVLIGKSTRAAAANFGFWLCVWGVVPLMMGMLAGAAGNSDAGKIISVLVLPNPIPLTVVAGTGSLRPHDFDSYELYDLGRLGTFEFLVVVGLFLTGYAVFAYAVLKLAARILAERSTRVV